ncbi:MAG TPA: 30S ribosomal protein S20, partial [Verrucomicrobiae bacterium]|nr:30S ribosomal protein S20 [Verrucomicrobiae bacterium]
MPNIKSAIKRVQLSKQRTLRNASLKSALRTSLKRFEEALATDAANAKPALTKAVRSLDKAVTKGIIHKNAAARKKSRLTRKL